MPGHEHAAARTILSVQAALAARGSHLATAALAGARHFVEWSHYPRGDCVDAEHGSEFYYHAHEAARRAPGEHGHFHVFSRHDDGRFWHLAGISLDSRGRATRLFTTNRWVTGEAWVPTERMQAALDGFALRQRGRMAPVARWIEAMLHLYRPLILDLMRERDAWLQAQTAATATALEDRRVHIVSERAIDIFADIARCLDAPAAPSNII